MYERFTDRARKVMQLANQEAQRFNHEYIGTEHILLGLVKEGSGVAANVLKNLDIDLRKIRLEVEKIVQSGPDMVSMGKLPQTPASMRAIGSAISEARALNHNYIGTEHLLLGLIDEGEGLAYIVLAKLGVTAKDVREEILAMVKSPGSAMEDQKKGEPPTVPMPALGWMFVSRIQSVESVHNEHGEIIGHRVQGHFQGASLPFNAGELVTLISGSPEMHVLDVGIETGFVFCSWVDCYGKQEIGSWPVGALKKKEKTP